MTLRKPLSLFCSMPFLERLVKMDFTVTFKGRLRLNCKLSSEKVISSTVGIFSVGKMSTAVEEVVIDDKGRVLIPKKFRDKVGLQPGVRARLKIEGKTIVIIPPISPEEFIKEMEGCIKEGTPSIDPLKLKKMWEPA